MLQVPYANYPDGRCSAEFSSRPYLGHGYRPTIVSAPIQATMGSSTPMAMLVNYRDTFISIDVSAGIMYGCYERQLVNSLGWVERAVPATNASIGS
jgi:hypothetical protein